MSGQENINFKLQIGEVHNMTGYLRVDISDNQTGKSEIASQCGVYPETGSVFIRVGNAASSEELDNLFTGLTDDDTLQELMESGEIQIFPGSSHKWYKLSLGKLFSGDVERDLLPVLATAPHLSGTARLLLETGVTEADLRAAVAADRSYLLAFLQTFRLQASTSLTDSQLQDFVQFVSSLAGFPLVGLMSVFRANLAAELVFESPERLPKHLQKRLLDLQNIGPEEDFKEFLTEFLLVAKEPFELHFFASDLLAFKVSAHFPLTAVLESILGGETKSDAGQQPSKEESRKSARSFNLLLLGLEASGKSSIFERMTKSGNQNSPLSTDPRTGSFIVDSVSYVLWDFDGSQNSTRVWQLYFEVAQAIIFVVDSTNRDSFQQIKLEIESLMEIEENKKKPLLVLANKQDLPNSNSVSQICDSLRLFNLRNIEWYLQASSAVTEDGISEGLSWLSQRLLHSE